jgi:hypothetical protein
LIARTLGRLDEAIDQLARGVEVADAMQARPHAVRARWWLARTLLERDAGGDADRARALLEAAEQSATEHDFAISARVRETREALA